MSVLLQKYPDCANWANISESRYRDIDQQAACLTGYDQRYRQLSAGRYRGWFKTALLGPYVGVFFETFNQTLEQWGACPPDHYGFIFLMGEPRDCMLKDRRFDAGWVMFATPGACFDFTAGPGTRYCVINVARDVFDTYLQAYNPDLQPASSGMGSCYFIQDRLKVETLRQMARQAVQMASGFTSAASEQGALAGFQTSLLTLLVSYVSGTDLCPVEELEDWPNSLAKTALAARDHLQSSDTVDIGAADLAIALGVSRRKLEYAFRSHFDKSPSEYIRLVQLNRIRSALLDEANRNASIGDIAGWHGVWHLSRFAQEYRNWFGELPSETRKLVSQPDNN